MKVTLLIVSSIVGLLLVWSAISFLRNRTLWRFVQLTGAAFLTITVFAHICEELNLLPAMRWGAPDSMGHYLDLFSAVVGISLFVLGYLKRCGYFS